MEPLRMTTLIQTWQLPMLLFVFLPLTCLWAYALYDCVRGGPDRDVRDVRDVRSMPHRAPAGLIALTTESWMLLLFLSGWFGALAYFTSVTGPRLYAWWLKSPA